MPFRFPQTAVRAAAFDDVQAAVQAVRSLLQEGIPRQRLSVVCSDEHKAKYFSEYVDDVDPESLEPSESEPCRGCISDAGLAGLGLGGLAVLSGVLTHSGNAVLVMGGLAEIAIAGSFAAAMMSRGAEKELADFYDRAIADGSLLVVVEGRSGDDKSLASAERVFTQSGSWPITIDRD